MLKRHNQGRFVYSRACVFIILTLLTLFASDSLALAQASAKRFARGDGLRLTIWQPWQIGDGKGQNNIDIGGDYLIDGRGYVFLPLLGDVKVISHDALSLAEELKGLLNAYMQEPVVIVEPLIRVALLGAFRRPGTYLIQPDASLWALVDLAGGPDDNSNLRKMYVERSGRLIKKSLLSGFERSFTLQELDIRSGDQILLPQRGRFGVKDAFEILRFGVTLLNVYLLVERIGD